MPELPYYAVIFSSLLKEAIDKIGYAEMAARMEETAAQESGYLGIESGTSEAGSGVTISYWSDLESIQKWKQHLEHQHAQKLGQTQWYKRYRVRICRVEREYSWGTGE